MISRTTITTPIVAQTRPPFYPCPMHVTPVYSNASQSKRLMRIQASRALYSSSLNKSVGNLNVEALQAVLQETKPSQEYSYGARRKSVSAVKNQANYLKRSQLADSLPAKLNQVQSMESLISHKNNKPKQFSKKTSKTDHIVAPKSTSKAQNSLAPVVWKRNPETKSQNDNEHILHNTVRSDFTEHLNDVFLNQLSIDDIIIGQSNNQYGFYALDIDQASEMTSFPVCNFTAYGKRVLVWNYKTVSYQHEQNLNISMQIISTKEIYSKINVQSYDDNMQSHYVSTLNYDLKKTFPLVNDSKIANALSTFDFSNEDDFYDPGTSFVSSSLEKSEIKLSTFLNGNSHDKQKLKPTDMNNFKWTVSKDNKVIDSEGNLSANLNLTRALCSSTCRIDVIK